MTARLGVKCSLPVVVAAVIAAGAVSAQEGRPGPGTRIIVRAVANGEPVTDLKAEEVALRINGKAHEISSLQLVSAADAVAAVPSTAGAAPKPSTLPPPFESNKAAAEAPTSPGGREFLIVMDEDGIGPGHEQPVKKAIGRLMSEARESDRFGYLSLRLGGPSIPPVAGRGAVTDVLATLVGAASSSETSVDLTCRSKRAMDVLASTLQAAPAGRTLVMFTTGFSATPPEVASIRSRVDGQGNIDKALPATCEIRSTDLERFGNTAAMSPANMFIVHYPQGLASQQNQTIAQSGIDNIAGVSNSELVRMQGGDEPSLSRIIRETSSYYIATVDGVAPGPMRRIEVRVKRDGVRVAARPAGGDRSAAAAVGSGKVTPRDMIRVATVYRDLPLRAAAFLSKQPKSNDVTVMVMFEPEDPEVKFTAATIMYFDEKGTGKAQWNAQGGDLQRAPVVAASAVPVGTYRVRIAATDAQGRGGTTDIDLKAQVADAAPVKLGSLILGTDPKSWKLQFAATDKQVIGFLPIYGVAPDMNIAVTYEIRENETAQPMGATGGNPLPAPSGAADERLFWGGFGLEPLAPGDYLMRAVVSVNGKEVGTASRTLRKTK